jgi:2-dehydro-3-deoxygalactonokinase
MDQFLSCDWGTSSFRLRCVNTATFEYTSIESRNLGIARIFDHWKQEGINDAGRLKFYAGILKEQLVNLANRLGFQIHGLPLVISGMATSSLGMVELPYKEIPAMANGSDLFVKKMNVENISHGIYLVSGLKTSDDVMRGEETQLAGCSLSPKNEELVVLPGTHSKHIYVKDGVIQTFRTFMTGELFDLISTTSILSASVKKTDSLSPAGHLSAFESGVRLSQDGNLVKNLFSVRTNALFKKRGPEENYCFLSGLLIGSELINIAPSTEVKRVTLVADEILLPYYKTAFHALGRSVEKGTLMTEDATIALIRGQQRILAACANA